MNDLPWPKKGNKAFVENDDDRAFHIRSIINQFPHHADTFRNAAETLLDTHIEGDDRHRDELFLPIAYLYRHSIELRLKNIVAIGMAMGFYDREKAKAAMLDHNLASLW